MQTYTFYCEVNNNLQIAELKGLSYEHAYALFTERMPKGAREIAPDQVNEWLSEHGQRRCELCWFIGVEDENIHYSPSQDGYFCTDCLPEDELDQI